MVILLDHWTFLPSNILFVLVRALDKREYLVIMRDNFC